MSRKECRFTRWLIWCAVIGPASALAQNFDPIGVGQSLSSEVTSGNVTTAQFSQLQERAIENFLATEQAQTYFQKNFVVDGVYGELKSGTVVNDWETLAKAMGTSGAVLAGAYALWRQRRREQLEAIANGDLSSVEAEFAKSFGGFFPQAEIDVSEVNAITTSGENQKSGSAFAAPTIPQTPTAWEAWAKDRGLVGTGATIALLFGLWNKRQLEKSKPDPEINPNFVAARSNTESRNAFLQVLKEKLESERAHELQAKIDDLGLVPVTKPTKSKNAQAYQRYVTGSIYQVYGHVENVKRNLYGSASSLSRYNWPKEKILSAFDDHLEQAETAYGYYFNGLSLGQRAHHWTLYPFRINNALKHYLNVARPHLSFDEYQKREIQVNLIHNRVKDKFVTGKADLQSYQRKLADYDQKQAIFEKTVDNINQGISFKINETLSEASSFWQNEEQKIADAHEYQRLSTSLANNINYNRRQAVIEREADFENLLQKASEEIGWDKLKDFLNSDQTTAVAGSPLLAKFARLKSGEVNLDADPEALFAVPKAPIKLTLDEAQELISEEKKLQTGLKTAQKELDKHQALLPNLDTLINQNEQTISQNEAVMEQYKASVDSFNYHQREAGRLEGLAYSTGYYNRRNGRFYPNQAYKNQAVYQRVQANAHLHAVQRYYGANSLIAASKRNLAQYQEYKETLPDLIEAQEKIVAEKAQRINEINEALNGDPNTLALLLEAERDAKIQQLRDNFGRWLNGYTGMSDYYQWSRYYGHNYRYYNWRNRSYIYSSVVRQFWGNLQNSIQDVYNDPQYAEIAELKSKSQAVHTQYEADLVQRNQDISEYKELQAMLPTFNQLRSYVRKIDSVSNQSAYFKNTENDLTSAQALSNEIDSLQSVASPYQARIAELTAKINKSNDLTVYERLAMHTPQEQAFIQSRGLNRLANDMMRDRKYLLQNQNHWDYKLSKHVWATNSSRSDYTPEYETMLRDLANKATAAEQNRLTGWEKLFREHPDLNAQKKQNYRTELELLQKQEAEWTANVQAEIAEKEAAKAEAFSAGYQNLEWLSQSEAERSQNDLTENIVAAETVSEVASGSNNNAKGREWLQIQHETAQASLKLDTQTLGALYGKRFHDVVDNLVGQMKFYATPEGKKQTDAIFDQDAINERRKEYDRLTQDWTPEQKEDFTPSEYVQGYRDQSRGIDSTASNKLAGFQKVASENPQTSAQPQTNSQVNSQGEIDTRNVVDPVEQHAGQSSENPNSIAQATQVMAQLAWMQAHRKPAITEKLTQLLSGVSAKQAAEIQNQITQKTAEITQNYEAQKKADATKRILNLGVAANDSNPSNNPVVANAHESTASSAFEKWIDEDLAGKVVPPVASTSPLEVTGDSVILNGAKLAVKAHTLGFIGSMKEIDNSIHEGVSGASKQAGKDILGLINLVFSGAALTGSLQEHQIIQDILLHKEAGLSQKQVWEFFQANRDRIDEIELLKIKNNRQQFGANVYTVGTLIAGLGQMAAGVRGSAVSSKLITDLDDQLAAPSGNWLSRLKDGLTEKSKTLAANLGIGDRVLLQGANGQTYSVPANKLDDLVGIGDSPSQKSVGSGGVVGGKSNLNSLVNDPKYIAEIPDYPKEAPFDAKKMIADGVIRKTRYNIDELGELLSAYKAQNIGQVVDDKVGEIIFVMKANGEMVFSMRRATDYLPHPVLSNGEDVISAGTITPGNQPGQIFVSNKSGHFQPKGGEEALEKAVFGKLEQHGYEVELDEPNIH